MVFCQPSDVDADACIRRTWSALSPALLTALLCIYQLVPVPARARTLVLRITSPLKTFLTLEEAEALAGEEDNYSAAHDAPSPWRVLVFAGIGLLQTLTWVAIGAYNFVDNQPDDTAWKGIAPLLVAFSWLYTTARPVIKPTLTTPYDLFSIYSVLLATAVLQLGGVIVIFDPSAPAPSTLSIFALTFNLILVLIVLSVLLGMPMALPSKRVNPEHIGKSVTPEDYTTLFGWLTFQWVYPLIKRGRNTTLDFADVWGMSPTFQSKAVFLKFTQIHQSTLLRKLFFANSLDIILDFALTVVSVVFNYAAPFFLKRILDIIGTEQPSPELRARAYVYAFLAFFSALCKAEADVQHLWYGRRASTRVRSELMAAIYDKALKRKDFSGIIDKEKQEEAAAAKIHKKAGTSESAADKKAKDAKADDPKSGADVGKIVNLMAGDANRVSQMLGGIYFLYGAPFEIIIACTFLYQLLGISAFAGFSILVAGWPLNSYIARRSIRIQKGVLASRDKRMSVLNELIGAIKFIKFFAWEQRWIDRVLDAREVEMKWMIKARINSVMFYMLWTCAPILVSITSFFTYVYFAQGELTVSVAFTAIALFAMVRAPLNVIPAWIVQILQTGVALKRIEVYLNEDEVSSQVSSLKAEMSEEFLSGSEDEILGFENASFKWNEVEPVIENAISNKADSPANTDAVSITSPQDTIEDHRFELRDISIIFPDGKLTVVTGPTASGKSALLLALLGEMSLLPTSTGRNLMSKNPTRVENGLSHSISYAAQTPWLRHQSIKDNIVGLSGEPFDQDRYDAVLECCALLPDLNVLEDGDLTEIGARGVSLSGGQKARVALARAVYARTKYVLLDDPLSAVDSHTSRFLFEKLFQGPLLANRTVILVTHHVELVLPGTHYLIRMLDGRVDSQGTLEDLRSRGILSEIAQDATADVHQEPEKAVVAAEPTEPADPTKKPRKLIKDEHREIGGVKWNIYNTYIKASSYSIWAFLFFLVILAQVLGVSEKIWIKIWGEAYDTDDQMPMAYMLKSSATPEHELSIDAFGISSPFVSYHDLSSSSGVHRVSNFIKWPDAREHPLFFVGIYTAIGLLSALMSVASTTAQYTGALRASRTLFKKLLVGVVGATMRWMDITPQGRMLNRFGKDIETVDSSLAGSLQAVNSSLATFFASILTVIVVFPAFLAPAILIGLVYRELAIGYLNTGRDLRRMEANTRSPIFADFGELLEGIVTVRAFSAEKRFLNNLHLKIDTTTKMWYGFWMTNRWLLLQFDALGALAVLFTTLFSLSSFVSAGTAGVCITSSMAFTTSIYWSCRFLTALELDLNSVERVVEYLDLPQEPPAVIENSRPPAYWPSSAANPALLTVDDLVIKYDPVLPPVLHGVSFSLAAGERVGLVGKTGSGKSTLAMSLLRFVDPSSGKIIIDGIDITSIGIHDLRSRITFIPQDATLFSGTLRDNLDPFNEHEDIDCLDVLYRVQMISQNAYESERTSQEHSRASSIHRGVEREDTAESIASTATETDRKTTINLDTQVSAGGTNFSQGQRQLVAMARALLRRSPIIILDEATSSIDFSTDSKIQLTIREEFKGSLLLTVAHRIRTVIDYDRLIVLDKGKVVEFDTPYNLMQKKNGLFRSMCFKSGSFSELEASAKAKAEQQS